MRTVAHRRLASHSVVCVLIYILHNALRQFTDSFLVGHHKILVTNLHMVIFTAYAHRTQYERAFSDKGIAHVSEVTLRRVGLVL